MNRSASHLSRWNLSLYPPGAAVLAVSENYRSISHQDVLGVAAGCFRMASSREDLVRQRSEP